MSPAIIMLLSALVLPALVPSAAVYFMEGTQDVDPKNPFDS